MKILFLARSLGRGGAERQLVTLVKGLRGRDIDARIALFYRAGGLDDEAQKAGVPLVYLGKSGRWDLAGFLLRFSAMVRRERPQILHGYLPVPNILAALAKPLTSHLRVVWGVRASNMDPSRYDRLSRLSYGLERRLSGIPDLIISNSHAGRDRAIARGFPAERTVVVPNGIDVARFKPDPEAGAKIRQNWGVAQKEKVVGLVGRLDPMKDHGTFLEAAAILAEQRQDIRFACIGGGPLDACAALEARGRDLGGRLIWDEGRDDMASVHNALDLLCSSSAFGEGFPNVIGEAMACGVPCVVTDVGDSAEVVGETGIVVPPGDPEALARGIGQMLERNDAGGPRVRHRILERYSGEEMVRSTERELLRLVR